jgi:hypothetical protein
MSYVVTLVHGTWAGKRKWTTEGSPLRLTLQRHLGQVEFRAVEWNGGNWAHDRLAAAERIRSHLIEELRERPDARHFVIAHSHGGNAVLYALRDVELQRNLAGVVMLATPFLHVGAPQFNEDSATAAMRGALILLAFLIALVVFGFAVDPIAEWLQRAQWLQRFDQNNLFGSLFALMALVFAIFVVPRLVAAPFFLGSLASERFADRFRRLRHELTLPKDLAVPVLILRTTGDEASAALAVSQFLSWLIVKVTAVLAVLASKVAIFSDERELSNRELFWVRMAVVAGWPLIFVVWARKYEPIVSVDFAYPVWTLIVSLIGSLTAILLCSWAARIILLTCVLLVLLIRVVSLLPFGVDIAAASIVLQITAEATPPGAWNLTHVSGRVSESVTGLAHTYIYNDEDALIAIAKFLREQGVASIVP